MSWEYMNQMLSYQRIAELQPTFPDGIHTNSHGSPLRKSVPG